jgi:hypothetical protein
MAKKPKKPIMTANNERFMAFEGLLQWTYAVITQSERVAAALSQQRIDLPSPDPVTRHEAILNLHSECHFFAIAAYKLIEHQEPRGTWRFSPYREQSGGGPHSAGA